MDNFFFYYLNLGCSFFIYDGQKKNISKIIYIYKFFIMVRVHPHHNAELPLLSKLSINNNTHKHKQNKTNINNNIKTYNESNYDGGTS